MSDIFGRSLRSIIAPADRAANQLVVRRPALQRILAFTGFSIDDVVDNPIAKNAVRGYFKLSLDIDRQVLIRELEEQWRMDRLR